VISGISGYFGSSGLTINLGAVSTVIDYPSNKIVHVSF